MLYDICPCFQKDAVRTSILSSRWRFLFSSVSTLDFSHEAHLLNGVDFVDDDPRLNLLHRGDISYQPFHVAINALSLVYFKYSGILLNNYSLVNLNSLVKADISDIGYGFSNVVNVEAVTNLFNGISNV
ncbi:PREDICTED: uncharacterized protein LOC108660671 [Theobroma cacao]|uniref:Uncharacterized protein LOC108660671 n=1 Tax=Theobroma cacao TaxID=3641 RepID=A0AB32VUK8_THECC|nr:PREDICTED: uncharacterized protein LOC108660671 [Theobroma cacao]